MSRNTRTGLQQVRDFARIAELSLQQYKIKDIQEILEAEWGMKLSYSTISSAIQIVKDRWTERRNVHVDALLNQELARVDTLEAELWRATRRRLDPKTRTTFEKIARQVAEEEEGDPELLLKRVTETIESGQDDASLYSQIADAHKERRRLLGLYAAQTINIHKTEDVKTYKIVSPDDWPDKGDKPNIIEGDFSE